MAGVRKSSSRKTILDKFASKRINEQMYLEKSSYSEKYNRPTVYFFSTIFQTFLTFKKKFFFLLNIGYRWLKSE